MPSKKPLSSNNCLLFSHATRHILQALEISMYWFYFYEKMISSVRVGSIEIIFVVYRSCVNIKHSILFILLKLTVKHEPSDWSNSEKRRQL